MPTKEETLSQMRELLVELFELKPEQVTLEAKLYEDLGLDSIDAVDLVVRLQRLTGRKINIDQYRTIRTVDDLVTTVWKMRQEPA